MPSVYTGSSISVSYSGPQGLALHLGRGWWHCGTFEAVASETAQNLRVFTYVRSFDVRSSESVVRHCTATKLDSDMHEYVAMLTVYHGRSELYLS